MVSIEDIKVGMKVYSKNLKTNKIELKEVANTMKYEVKKDMVKVYVDGEVIESTWEHPYYVKEKGWTVAGSLNINDILITADGEKVKVKNIEFIKNEGDIIEVYNFEVKDNHNYFVGKNNILVHNKQWKEDGSTSTTTGVI